MTVAEHAPGRELLRGELERFVFKPGARGQLRLEAARGHDDLVIATALAVLAADIGPLELQNYSGRPCRLERQLGASVPSPQRSSLIVPAPAQLL